MKNRYLCEKAQEYILKQYEIFEDLKKQTASLPHTESIAESFVFRITALNEAQIQMSRILPEYTVYVPLRKIARNNISNLCKINEELQNGLSSCRKMKNTSAACTLFRKKERQIEFQLFEKIESVKECCNIDVMFIRFMLPICRSTVFSSRNFLRFESCPQVQKSAEKLIFGEQDKIRKLDYLFHCMR